MNRQLNFAAAQPRAWVRLAWQVQFVPQRMANEAGVGLPHLRRLFRQTWGEPLEGWLQEQRLVAACWLLAEGTPVKATAELLGFRYPTHFGRLFLQAYGLSPGQFTRRFRLAWDDRLTRRPNVRVV